MVCRVHPCAVPASGTVRLAAAAAAATVASFWVGTVWPWHEQHCWDAFGLGYRMATCYVKYRPAGFRWGCGVPTLSGTYGVCVVLPAYSGTCITAVSPSCFCCWGFAVRVFKGPTCSSAYHALRRVCSGVADVGRFAGLKCLGAPRHVDCSMRCKDEKLACLAFVCSGGPGVCGRCMAQLHVWIGLPLWQCCM